MYITYTYKKQNLFLLLIFLLTCLKSESNKDKINRIFNPVFVKLMHQAGSMAVSS